MTRRRFNKHQVKFVYLMDAITKVILLAIIAEHSICCRDCSLKIKDKPFYCLVDSCPKQNTKLLYENYNT